MDDHLRVTNTYTHIHTHAHTHLHTHTHTSHTWQIHRQAHNHTPSHITHRTCTFAALERTFLSWVSMAVTMGGVSSVLVSFSNSDAHSQEVGALLLGLART